MKARAVRTSWISETSLHFDVARYLGMAWPLDLPFTHFPAGERRDERTGGKLKRMGLKAGWPDFQLILPKGRIGFIELKVGDGKLSDEQAEFRRLAIKAGCGYAICRSVDEVEATLAGWLAIYGRTLRGRLT